MTNTTFDPQKLAEETLAEFETTFKKSVTLETDILDSLQQHYTTLESNQKLYIDYLSEFVEKIKTAQHTDKESLAQLKKQVLKHVLQSEKKGE